MIWLLQCCGGASSETHLSIRKGATGGITAADGFPPTPVSGRLSECGDYHALPTTITLLLTFDIELWPYSCKLLVIDR
jgi:hypothetical protein